MGAARHHPARARPLRGLGRGLIVAAALAAVLAAPARAQTPGSASGAARPLSQVLVHRAPPPGRERAAPQIVEAASRAPRLQRALARHPRSVARVYLRDRDRWQVSFYAGGREIAQAVVDDRSGRVREAWTGIQVAWPMARGYRGQFGRQASAAYVWIPLLVLFVLPFLRPPWRMLHLDLAVVAGLSVSYACFDHGAVRWSVPLAYPPLVYLLVRALVLARRGPAPREPLRLLIGIERLAVVAVFLLGVRLGLQVFASNVIDVGYGGVIGADRLTHGQALYGVFPASNPHGDTYGPLNYLAYVPFELVWPWSGTWDDLPAAHAATAVFDLACLALLARLGQQVGGRRLAVLLAYLWLACPWTLLAANSGANDPLVGALVLGALAAPRLRGALVAAAGMVKFAPLALIPLLIRGRVQVAAAAAVLGATLLLAGDLGTFADRTLGFQAGRDSPFSVWGLYDLPGLQRVAQAAALALSVGVAFTRRRDVVTLSALTAAVLLAAQLTVDHWFYLYLPWLLGPLLLALVAPYAGSGRRTGSIEAARPGPSQRISTALSHGSSSAAS